MVKSYTNKNGYFSEIIDEKLKERLKKTDSKKDSYLCDIDYNHRFSYGKCSIVSQLKKTDILGNKWHQYKHFKDWIHSKGKKMPKYMPDTYLIDKTNLDENLLKGLFEKKKKWIVKPENASFRAGIHVVTSYDLLIEWINKYVNNKWIIQDYIEPPLKIDGKKIHFRIYVLLIKTKEYSQVLVYNKGYMFTSKTKYDENSLDDDSNLSGGDSWEQMHLYPNTLIDIYGWDVYKKVLGGINEIVKDTMDAALDGLVCVNNKVEDYKCYKLLGYDILVKDNTARKRDLKEGEDELELYLAEINGRKLVAKFNIKNMYENLLDTIMAEGPITNDYLKNHNLEFYSVLERQYTEEEQNKKIIKENEEDKKDKEEKKKKKIDKKKKKVVKKNNNQKGGNMCNKNTYKYYFIGCVMLLVGYVYREELINNFNKISKNISKKK